MQIPKYKNAIDIEYTRICLLCTNEICQFDDETDTFEQIQINVNFDIAFLSTHSGLSFEASMRVNVNFAGSRSMPNRGNRDPLYSKSHILTM